MSLPETNRSRVILIGIYVNDLLIALTSPADSVELQAALSSEFLMKYLGFPTRFLGIQIKRTTSGMLFHQSDLITKMLSRFEVSPDQPTTTTPIHGPKD